MTQIIDTYQEAKRRYLGNAQKLASRATVARGFAKGRNKRGNASRSLVALCGAAGDGFAMEKVGYLGRNIYLAEFEQDIFDGASAELGHRFNIHYGCVSIMCRNLTAQGIRADVSLDLTSFLCGPSLALVKSVIETVILARGKRFELTYLASRDHDFTAECLALYPLEIPQDWPAYLKRRALSDHLRIVRKRLLRRYLNAFGKAQGFKFRLVYKADNPALDYFNQSNPGKKGGSAMSAVIFEVY